MQSQVCSYSSKHGNPESQTSRRLGKFEVHKILHNNKTMYCSFYMYMEGNCTVSILSVCIQHFRDWRWTFPEEIELSLGWPADISMCSRLLLVAATAIATASRSLAQGTTQVCCTFAKFLSQTVLKWCVPRKNYCDETIFFPLSSWLATFLVW